MTIRTLAFAAVAAIITTGAQAQFVSPYAAPNADQQRHNDPTQWTLEEMAQHQSYVTMPNGKSMTCTSYPNPILGTTDVHCN